MKKKLLALVMTTVMLMSMMPFAQISVLAEGEVIKSFDELIGNYINTGLTSPSSGLSFDTAAEFATFSGFNSATMTTTDDVLTLPATTAETAVNKNFVGYPLGSVLHYKINGFVGNNAKNDTSKPGIVLFYDNAYLLILPFNDVAGKPSLRGATAEGWKGLTDGIIDTTEPFEILVKRIGTAENEVWAKQTSASGNNYRLLGTVNASSGPNGNQLWLKSGNDQGIKFDFVKLYYNNEVSVVGALKNSLNANGHNTLNYYRKACGITSETWADFLALTNKSSVYTMDTGAITTVLEFGTAFTAAVAAQKAEEGGTGGEEPGEGESGDGDAGGETGVSKTYEELFGTESGNELKITKDTAEELAALKLSGTVEASGDGLLVLDGSSTETLIRQSFTAFPTGSMVYINIARIAGNASVSATSHPKITMNLMIGSAKQFAYMPFNNDKLMLYALQENGTYAWEKTAFPSSTASPFELVIVRKDDGDSWGCMAVYGREGNSGDFTYIGETRTSAVTGASPSVEIGTKTLNSQDQDVTVDFIKVYNPKVESGGSDDDTNPEPTPQGGKTFDELIGSAIENGEAKVDFSVDSAEEFENMTYYDGSTMTATDGILTLPPTDAETTVYHGVTSFPVGAALHYKIAGFSGSNNKNNTSKPATVMYFPDDSGVCFLMLPFNDVGGKPSLRGSTKSGWTGLTDEKIDTTQPFEILAMRTGTSEVNPGRPDVAIWGRQGSTGAFSHLGTVGTSASTETKGSLWLKSGNEQSVSYDFAKVYIPTELGAQITSELSVSEPESNRLLVSGAIKVGYTVENLSSHASVCVVAYHKEHGYTTVIKKHDITLTKGATTDVSHTFDISEVDLSKEDIAVLLWDDTGKALTASQGYSLTNHASGKPENSTPVGMTATANYNNVTITGYTGKKSVETVTIEVKDADGTVRALAQVDTNSYGMLNTTIGIDPYQNSSADETYMVSIKVGDEPATETTVSLLNQESFTGFDITNGETFKAFILEFGTESEKLDVVKDGVAEAAYVRFNRMAGVGNSGDFIALSRLAPMALKAELDDRALISQFNTAVSGERWTTMQKLIMETYADHLGVTAEDIIHANAVRSQKELFMRMVGKNYLTAEEILLGFRSAVTAQLAAESVSAPSYPVTGGGAAGGGGGGGAGGGAFVKDKEAETTPAIPDIQTSEQEFVDLETVPWAKDSINKLKGLQIVSGDGDGKFYPDRSISREEFLKLVIEALDIEPAEGEEPRFHDVDSTAWYYPYIKAAYQHGIVTGMSEEQFGIGENITRADMATIIVRAMSMKKMEMKLINNAIVFDDVWDIPNYARDSVNALYRAALINGKAEGVFAPLDDTTRAEAAVLIHRVLTYSTTTQ